MQQKPKVVICGSFHRDPDGLKRLFLELETSGCRIISPISLDFMSAKDQFVKSPSEVELSAAEIERAHLRAIREADMVWLHAPQGYTGLSGAFEVGYAHCLKKTIYCKTVPADEMLQNFVQPASSVFDALYL